MALKPPLPRRRCVKQPKERNFKSWALVRFAGFSVIASYFAIAAGHAEQYVEITSEIETVYYPPGRTNSSKSVRSFSVTCTVGTNQWRIDNTFSRNAETKWFFDGTNVYRSSSLTRPPSAKAIQDASKVGFRVAPFESAKSVLSIEIDERPDGCPLGDVGVNIPWLAFCSGPYLKREGRIVPLPIAILRHTPDGFAYRDKTEIFEDDLGLPRTVDLLSSKTLYERSVRKFKADNFDKGAPKESGLQEGVLKFRYAVTGWTNFLGWNFPIRFEYVQYDLSPRIPPAIRYGGVGTVKSIRFSDKPEGLFMPSMQQTVVDWRMRNEEKKVSGVPYEWTNTSAALTNDPILQKIFSTHVASLPPPGYGRTSRVRWGFIALLVIIATVPLILLRWKYSKQNKNT